MFQKSILSKPKWGAQAVVRRDTPVPPPAATSLSQTQTLWEISHFDPPQTIEYTRVLEQYLLMLQTENEKKHEQENSPVYITPQKRKKK